MKNAIRKRAAFRQGCTVLLCMLSLCACGKESYQFYGSTEEVELSQDEMLEDGTSRHEAADKQIFYVHICGAVVQPGVYCVSEGSRLYEVILLAGGMTKDAADAAVNQAQELTDGMQIYIPTEEEMQVGGNYAAGTAGMADTVTAVEDTRININTADLAQLCTLPGIGETRARAILTYRAEHGAFRSAEELMNVTGIKSGVYEKIKNLIRV